MLRSYLLFTIFRSPIFFFIFVHSFACSDIIFFFIVVVVVYEVTSSSRLYYAHIIPSLEWFIFLVKIQMSFVSLRFVFLLLFLPLYHLLPNIVRFTFGDIAHSRFQWANSANKEKCVTELNWTERRRGQKSHTRKACTTKSTVYVPNVQ